MKPTTLAPSARSPAAWAACNAAVQYREFCRPFSEELAQRFDLVSAYRQFFVGEAGHCA
ncbi:MAG: hypothetical protein ACT4NY_27290 [Pseudonocardiales bacterium]